MPNSNPPPRHCQSTPAVHEHPFMQDQEMKALEHFGLGNSRRFCELGCGNAEFLARVAKSYPELPLTGVCSRADALEAARTELQPKLRSLALVHAPPWASGLPDASFDFVYHRFMRVAQVDIWEVIMEASRLVEPGGVVCLAAADADWVTAFPECPALSTIRGVVWDDVWSQTGAPRSGRAIGSLLLKSGLSKVDVQTFSISTCEIDVFDWMDTFVGPWLEQLPSQHASLLSDSLAMELSSSDAVAMGTICLAAGRR